MISTSVPDPITVTICNSVLLDPEKILNYNESSFDNDIIEFLSETVKNNFSYHHSDFAFLLPVKSFFLLSERTFHEFKLDLERFMFFCTALHLKKNCISDFKWHLESSQNCYKATFALPEYGDFHAIQMDLYFDPNLRFGRYKGCIKTKPKLKSQQN